MDERDRPLRFRPPSRRGRLGDGPRRRRRLLRRLHRHHRERPVGERGVRGARVNLASKRVTVEWDEGALTPKRSSTQLDALGYPAYPFSAPAVDGVEAAEETELLRCLGVAAFGAMNVMLLSVALWSGAARPTPPGRRAISSTGSRRWSCCRRVAYAGRPFFDSALRALKQRTLNMDVPITLGVVLSLMMSVVQTLQHARRPISTAASMLLMFLLAGRALDQRMRRKTRDVASNLAAIKAETATKLIETAKRVEMPIAADHAGRSRAGARGRTSRRRRRGRGRPVGNRPEPRHRRDRAGRGPAGRRWSMPAR